ncbi:putative replication-associated protein [Sakkuthvirus batchis]|uniref:Replication-associated protein n=1 Tax=Bat circovirus ZS/China/2011 TaxID=1072162 RepID=G1D7G0_9CIRC|nr:putative replication-associated protein [Bat circovirus ZS/China/2011]
MPCLQARYWLLTIPYEHFTPYLPPNCAYIKGQLEQGSNTSYLHWQLVVYFSQKKSLNYVKLIFGDGIHCEPSKSKAAEEYVWKEDTSIPGTQFELGKNSIKRDSTKDWDLIVKHAREGDFASIPGDVLVRCYGNLKKIRVDSLQPESIVREIYVYYGRTGAGKSRRAWEEATLSAYPKDPNTKFWDGYAGQECVVIDEFRGAISISHLLRWLDRYPVIVEIKGSSCVFKAKKIWITSNLSPDDWYPDLDAETKSALRRRFTEVVHFN